MNLIWALEHTLNDLCLLLKHFFYFQILLTAVFLGPLSFQIVQEEL